jgi:hypothetical protein
VLYEFSETSVEIEGVTTRVDAMKFAALITEELMVVVLSDGTVRGALVIIEPVVNEFVVNELVLIVFAIRLPVVVVAATTCPV